MILTLIASGPILKCLCVAPISAAPAMDKGGFSPVRIQIEQIIPASSSGIQEGDLRAEIAPDPDDATPASDGPDARSESVQGEITINTTPPEMTGSIPGASFRGSRRAMARLSQISTKALAPVTITVTVKPRKEQETAKITSKTSTPAPQLSPESDRPIKTQPIESETPSDYPDISNPETKSLSTLPPPVEEISEINGAFKCSANTSADLASFLRVKFPQITVQQSPEKEYKTVGRFRHRKEFSTILVHGPPDVVEQALDAAQHWAPAAHHP
jgi:hypothetical protein